MRTDAPSQGTGPASILQPDIELAGIVSEAIEWCDGEIARLDSVLSRHDRSGAALGSASNVVERATTRIREINDMSLAQSSVLPATSLLNTGTKRSDPASIRSDLEALSQFGSDLGRGLAGARVRLGTVRRVQRYAVNLLSEIAAVFGRTTGRVLSSFETPARALNEAIAVLSDRTAIVETKPSPRVSLTSELGQLDHELGIPRDPRPRHVDFARRIEAIKSAICDIAAIGYKANAIAHAATVVRTRIVRGVFSGSLNKAWRDLFVRLAPAGQFVPQTELPQEYSEKVENAPRTV